MDNKERIEKLLSTITIENVKKSRWFSDFEIYRAIEVPTQEWMYDINLDDALGFIKFNFDGVDVKYAVVGISVGVNVSQIIYNSMAISDTDYPS